MGVSFLFLFRRRRPCVVFNQRSTSVGERRFEKKKANETPHNQIPHIFMFRVTNEHKRTKKKAKKEARDVRFFFVFFRCRHRHREDTIVVVTFFTSLAESPDDDDENFGNA